MNTNITFYDIANKFLIGFLFLCGWVIMFFHQIINYIGQNEILQKIPTGAETILTICFVASIYEIGFLINRISSVGVEELFITLAIFPQRSIYTQYNDAKKYYNILPTLASEYDFCKGHATLFLLLSIIALFFAKWIIMVIFFVIVIIFIFSGRKYSTRINELVTQYQNTLPNLRA